MSFSHCPCCHSAQLIDFFVVKNAPIFSVVTVATRKEALDVPKRDIQLALCQGCGFVFNRSYDTGIDYFTLGYEDQQGFSATFMAYLTRISLDLVERYRLQGKTLLEIGCGKGDFINLLTEMADGYGIGIDPAYVEGRQVNPRLTFYPEFYGPEHAGLRPDFICCRHTLEHISDPLAFMQLLRGNIPPQQSPVLFVEVPQINRILEIQAFWDIYFEHCSYFNATSLAALFRNAGFKVLDIRLDYDDQYLLIEAVPATEKQPERFSLEDPVSSMLQRVLQFQEQVSLQLSEWRQRLEVFKKAGRRVVIWGGGSKSVGFLTHFADLGLIDYVVDINPNMEGNYIPGIGSRYVQPAFLISYQPDIVIIMNGVYREEITRNLIEMGLNPEIYIL